jgi:hypothetical protein
MRDVLTLLAGQPALSFAPGSRYAYTNTNYSLLSLVVERAGGAPFDHWMRDNVFAPLDMTSTSCQTDCSRLIPNRAAAYLPGEDGYRLARPSNVEIPGSAHAFTNLADMSRWLGNLRGHRLGGERVFERLTTPGVLDDGSPTSYAAGLVVGKRHGVQTISHTGQTGGYKTMLIYCPEQELGVVVLANLRSIDAAGIAREMLDVCLGHDEAQVAAHAGGSAAAGSEQAESTPFSISSDILARYAGGYRLEGGGLIGIYDDRQWLVVALQGLGGDFFSARSEVEFTDHSGQAIITFEQDEANEVTALRLRLNGHEQRAHRVDTVLDVATLAPQLQGSYHCAALGSSCQIAADGDRLILAHRRYDAIDLHCVGPDRFFCDWGFMHLERAENGTVTGFKLTDELFAWHQLTFVKIDL